jgi:hypothetical protein
MGQVSQTSTKFENKHAIERALTRNFRIRGQNEKRRRKIKIRLFAPNEPGGDAPRARPRSGQWPCLGCAALRHGPLLVMPAQRRWAALKPPAFHRGVGRGPRDVGHGHS